MHTSWIEAVAAGVRDGAVILRPAAHFPRKTEAVVERFHGIKRAAVIGDTQRDALDALAAELERVQPWFAPLPEPAPVLEVSDPEDGA